MMRISWERLFGEGRAGRTIRVEKIRASRAAYVSQDYSRVEVEVQVEGGQRIILDMNVEQCGRLVHELINAHDAIHPPLRPRLGGTYS